MDVMFTEGEVYTSGGDLVGRITSNPDETYFESDGSVPLDSEDLGLIQKEVEKMAQQWK